MQCLQMQRTLAVARAAAAALFLAACGVLGTYGFKVSGNKEQGLDNKLRLNLAAFCCLPVVVTSPLWQIRMT